MPNTRDDLTYPLLWAGLDEALRVIKVDPKSPEAWKFLGQMELSRRIPSLSLSPAFSLTFDAVRDLGPARCSYALRRAHELIPQDYTTLVALARLFIERTMLGEARIAMEKAIRIPTINLSQVENNELAKNTIAEIREKMGERPSLEWQNLSELDQVVSRLIATGRIKQLADLLEKAYPEDRASWDEIDKVATARLQLGEPQQARGLWSRSKAPAQDGIRQARIAATYLAEGDFDRARKMYHEAIEASPKLFEAHYGLALLEQDSGNADEAHDHALIAMDLSGDNKNRFTAAQGIAGRVSRFQTRPTRVPALQDVELLNPVR